MKRALLALAVLLSLACTTLTPAGSHVRITTNPDVVRECSYVGNVTGRSTSWGLLDTNSSQPNGMDQANAETHLRNYAASIGADVVYLNRSSAWAVSGEAYSCAMRRQPSPRPSPASEEAAPDASQAAPAREDAQVHLFRLMDELARKGKGYEPLLSFDVRVRFRNYLLKVNPDTDRADISYVQDRWFSFVGIHPEIAGGAARAGQPDPEGRWTREDARAYLDKLIDELAARGEAYRPLWKPDVRGQFVAFLITLNPRMSEIDLAFLDHQWIVFLARPTEDRK